MKADVENLCWNVARNIEAATDGEFWGLYQDHPEVLWEEVLGDKIQDILEEAAAKIRKLGRDFEPGE